MRISPLFSCCFAFLPMCFFFLFLHLPFLSRFWPISPLAHSSLSLSLSLHLSELRLRVVGGKGGFGAQLRGTHTRVGQKKTTNFDACRDLSGRRLRHVQTEEVVSDRSRGQSRALSREQQALQMLAEERKRREKESDRRQEEQRRFDAEAYHGALDSASESVSLSVQRGMEILREQIRMKKNKRASEAEEGDEGEEDKPERKRQATKPAYWSVALPLFFPLPFLSCF